MCRPLYVVCVFEKEEICFNYHFFKMLRKHEWEHLTCLFLPSIKCTDLIQE